MTFIHDQNNNDSSSSINQSYALRPTNDLVFKALFSYHPQSSNRLLLSFLSSFLPFPISSLEILPTDLYDFDNINAKEIRLDINAKINDQTAVNVEMQMSGNIREIGDRAYYYLCALTMDQPTKGYSYSKHNRVIQIFLLDFRHYRDEDSRHHFLIYNPKHKIQLTEKAEIIMIEIQKEVQRIENIEKMSLYQKWCYFLAKAEVGKKDRIIEEMMKEEIFREAMDVMERINADQRLKDMAFARKKREMDEAQIRYEGIKQGIQQNQLDTAKALLAIGMTEEQIEAITHLEIKEIHELKKSGLQIQNES